MKSIQPAGLPTFALTCLSVSCFAALIPSGTVIPAAEEFRDTSQPVLTHLGGERIAMMWTDEEEVDIDSFEDVYFSLSENGGLTWSEPFLVFDGGFLDIEGISSDAEGNIVACSDEYTFTALVGNYQNWEVFNWRAVPAGGDQAVTLNPTSAIAMDSATGRVSFVGSVGFGGNLEQIITFVAEDYFIGDEFFRFSLTEDLNGFASDFSSSWPNVAVATKDGHFWYAWEDSRQPSPTGAAIYVRYSPDNLETITGELAIPLPSREDGSPINAALPRVLVRDDGKLFLTFTDAINTAVAQNIYLVETVSLNPPQFSQPRILLAGEFSTEDTWTGVMTGSGNPAFVYARDNDDFDEEIRVLSTNDGGQNFEDDLWLSLETAAFTPHSVITFEKDGQELLGIALEDNDLLFTTAQLDFEAPAAPQNVTASGGDGYVDLQWEPSTDNAGIARYLIGRRPEGSGGEFVTAGFVPDLFFRDPEKSGAFEYIVIAEDLAGLQSSASAITAATAFTGAGLPPGQIYSASDEGVRRRQVDASNESIIIPGNGFAPRLFNNGEGFLLYDSEEDSFVEYDLDGVALSERRVENNAGFYDVAGDPFPFVYGWLDQCLNQFFITLEVFPGNGLEPVESQLSGEVSFDVAVSPQPGVLAITSEGAVGCTFTQIYPGRRLYVSNENRQIYTGYGAGLSGFDIDTDFMEADFNHDGTEIVVTIKDTESDFTEVWRYQVDAENALLSGGQRLTDSPAGVEVTNPQFSVDGEWITYRRGGLLMLVNRDGSQTRTLGFDAEEATFLPGEMVPPAPVIKGWVIF